MQSDAATTSQRPSALIVGASSGIGAALARRLARDGYAVALVARRSDLLDRLAGEINATTSTSAPVARTYVHDVHDTDAAPALFERILADCGGRLSVAVYAAGILPLGSDNTWTFAEERDTIETNVVGAIRWLSLAADAFARAHQGTIIGVSSVAGDRGRRGNSAYMASKAALSTYLESLRYRLHGTGVRVVTIKPGYVATPMTDGVRMPRPIVSSADAVANRIARACASRDAVVYVPGYWAPIMWLVRHLPAGVMARLPV